MCIRDRSDSASPAPPTEQTTSRPSGWDGIWWYSSTRGPECAISITQHLPDANTVVKEYPGMLVEFRFACGCKRGGMRSAFTTRAQQ